MSLSRRHFLAGASAAGVTGALAACSPSGSPSGGASGAGGPPVPMQFWSRENFLNGALQPILSARVAEFDKANNTQTETLFLSFADSSQKTQAALAAGKPPHVGQQGPDISLQFAAGGSLVAIDDLATELAPQMVQLQKDAYVKHQGKTFAMPWYTETRILMYHKDLVEKAGVKPPTTWDEWLTFSAALNKGDQGGLVIPGQGLAPGQLFIPLAASLGGALLDSNGKVTTKTEPFVAALDFLNKLFKQGMLSGTPTYKDTDAAQLFQLKKVASTWANGQVLQNAAATPGLKENIDGVLTPPATAGGTSRSFLGGFCLFAFDKSGNHDKSKSLIKHLFEPKWYGEYLAKSGGFALPVIKETAAQSSFSSGVMAKLVKQQETAIRYGGPEFGNAPFMGAAESQQVFANAVTEVWTGKSSPADSVKSMLAALTKLAG